ncbi:MAG: UDP-N-acetylglucosamine 1-carboxyvinyltransferase [Clostridia bacterium]|nr:UDP-N-acetylglucosamine 1-carboxyvinyltransferase [Clostridia bacterium]
MSSYLIEGGNKLFGKIKTDSAKNSILPILAATVLTDDECVIYDVPMYLDVLEMIKILKALGKKVEISDNSVIVSGPAHSSEVIMDEAKRLRSSIFFIGSLLGKNKRVSFISPGGCKIGKRPIDIHLMGLNKLGFDFSENFGVMNFTEKKLMGCVVEFPFPSVGATENIMMAASLINGEMTVIKLAAREPEVEDLGKFINSMGGTVYGLGTETIVIIGVKKLHGTSFKPIGDRILAGTLLAATAMCGGKVEVLDINPNFLLPLIVILRNSGCNIDVFRDKITLESCDRLKAISNLKTAVYPGFPTDLQSIMLSMMTIADGTSVIEENIFESRFKVADELIKMGASIKIDGNKAIVNGTKKLFGAQVVCPDLRGGAALVLAGLVAKGTSQVDDVFHIERGYFNFDEKLKSLGAKITKE